MRLSVLLMILAAQALRSSRLARQKVIEAAVRGVVMWFLMGWVAEAFSQCAGGSGRRWCVAPRF